MTTHIMWFARIDEEIWLGAGFDAGIDEFQTMLGYDCRIIHTLDNLQFAAQIFRLF